MKVELPSAELKKVMPGFGKIIGKGGLPLKIVCDRNGDTFIHGTNRDDFATVKVPNAVSEQAGEVLIPYDGLNKILKGCGNEEHVHVVGSEKETVIRYPIAGKFVDQKVDRIAPEEWPPIPRVNAATVVLDQKFQAAFRSAFDCASEDQTRPEINSVYLDVEDPKAHYVVATDGRHLFAANSFSFELAKSLALPTRKFLSWKGVLEDGQWRIGIKDAVKGPKGIIKEHGSVVVQTDNWTFITKAIEEEYPKWKNVLPDPKREKTTISLPPEPVALLLDIVLKIPGVNAQNKPLVLETNGKKFCIKGRNNDQEKWTVIPVDGAVVNGPAIAAHINRTFLLKAMRFGLTEIELTDPLDKVVFWGTGKKMIIMPLNPNPQAKPSTSTTPNVPAAESSTAAEKEPTDEERSTMPKTVNRIEEPQQSEEQEQNGQAASAFEQLEQQVETIKNTLRGVIGDLNEALKLVMQAHKEKRITDREIKSIRENLREIQQMKI